MRFDVHIYSHCDCWEQASRKLDAIIRRLDSLEKKEEAMSKELDILAAQVAANTDLVESAIVLLNQLADLLKQYANDPAKILALADELQKRDDELAAALQDNTPAA
jgi:DNA repair ATPase RecN